MRWWLLYCILYPIAVALLAGLGQVYPGDEGHFIATSRLFAEHLSLDTLRTYPEMSGPLPFLVFGAWGALFGWSLPAMRACSLLIAALTLYVAGLLFRDRHQPWLAPALLGLNPYWAAMSVFVYTDMFTVLLSLIAFRMAEKERPIPFSLAMAGALLSRQYLLFLPLAVAWQKRSLRFAGAAAVLPLAVLMAFWQGPAPASPVRDLYLTRGLSYHPEALTGYLALLFVFSLPWLIWRRPKLPLLPAALALLYFAAPVRPSAPSVNAGIVTTGLIDRALHATVPEQFGRDLFYAICMAGGLCLLAAIKPWRSLEGLTLLAFLAVMPFSYLYWEKYLLPVLPLAALACCMMSRYESRPVPAGAPAAPRREPADRRS